MISANFPVTAKPHSATERSIICERQNVKFIPKVLLACIIMLAGILTAASLRIYAAEDAYALETKSYTVANDLLTSVNLEAYSFAPSEYDGLLGLINQGEFGLRTELHHFIDGNGYYNLAYTDDQYLHIDRLDPELNVISRLTTSKIYPLFGDITADQSGNIYVIWGRKDETGKGGISTLAVAKYDSNANLLAKLEYPTTAGYDSNDCKEPFKAGGCHTIITSDGHLICNFAKIMYNGHQSNGIIDIDTKTMKKTDRFDNYVSHSFDQRVLELSDNGICMVNKGDALPRGFDLDYFLTDKERETPFHFYDDLGNNYVHGWLGGAVEINGNLFLVGASARSLDENSANEPFDLFIQPVGDREEPLGVKTSSRSGTSCGKYTKDRGIIWLTEYSAPYTVSNPQVVAIDDTHFMVLWEEIRKATNGGDAQFVQSYYMVIDENGVITHGKEALGVRLNSHEDPVFCNGSVYWSIAGSIAPKVEYTTVNGTTYGISGYGIVTAKISNATA